MRGTCVTLPLHTRPSSWALGAKALKIIVVLAVLTLIIPISQAESLNSKAVALAWIDVAASSQKELRGYGGRIAKLVWPVEQGKEPDYEQAMRLLLLYKNKVEDKIKYFRSIPSASFDGFKKFKAIYLNFLNWQSKHEYEKLRQFITLAGDRSINTAERARKLEDMVFELRREEYLWQEKLKKAEEAVNFYVYGSSSLTGGRATASN